MSSPFTDLSAIVVGGGPAGLAASLGLAAACSHVHVIERRPDFDAALGSTFGIAPNGRKALQALHPSVWGELEQVGIDLSGLRGGGGGSGGLMLPWWEMRRVIANVVQRDEFQDRIYVHLGESFVDLIESEDGVDVQCESGLRLQADFLVAADGVHSQVRKQLGLPPGNVSTNRVFRGFATVTEHASPELQALLHKGPVPMGHRELRGAYFLAFNFHQRHPGRIVWVVSTTHPIDEATTPLQVLLDAGLKDDDMPLLRELFESSNPESREPFLPGGLTDLSNAALAQYSDGGWGGRGRVTLVGDAAHAMRPTDGQGGNQAFEDAVVLRDTLLAAARATPGTSDRNDEKQDVVASTLRRFEAARLPRVKRIYDCQQERYERRMRGETIGPMDPAFQEWLDAGV